MAEFAVNTALLRQHADSMADLQRELNSVALRLSGLQLGSVMRIRASSILLGRITDCKWAVYNHAGNMRALSRGLESVAGLYDGCERSLANFESAQDGNHSDSNNTALDVFVDIASFFNGAMPIEVITMLYRFHSGNVEQTLKACESLFSVLGNTTNAIFNTNEGSTVWKDLIGFNQNGIPSISEGGLKAAWAQYVDDMTITRGGTLSKNLPVVCKWAGYALTVIANGVENYQEFDGNLGNQRFWGETVIESGVDIAMGVGAGVLAAALFPASAPVVLVGAAAAAAVWAVNGVVELATGKDIGEWVADGAYFIAEETIDFIGDASQAIADGLCNVGEAVADAIGDASRAICDGGRAFGRWAVGLFS